MGVGGGGRNARRRLLLQMSFMSGDTATNVEMGENMRSQGNERSRK